VPDRSECANTLVVLADDQQKSAGMGHRESEQVIVVVKSGNPLSEGTRWSEGLAGEWVS
jgi:hypothetical protein